jgi:hypothetical protein
MKKPADKPVCPLLSRCENRLSSKLSQFSKQSPIFFTEFCSLIRGNVHNRFIAFSAALIPQFFHSPQPVGDESSPYPKKASLPHPTPPFVANKQLTWCRHKSPNKTNGLRIGVRRESHIFQRKSAVFDRRRSGSKTQHTVVGSLGDCPGFIDS